MAVTGILRPTTFLLLLVLIHHSAAKLRSENMASEDDILINANTKLVNSSHIQEFKTSHFQEPQEMVNSDNVAVITDSSSKSADTNREKSAEMYEQGTVDEDGLRNTASGEEKQAAEKRKDKQRTVTDESILSGVMEENKQQAWTEETSQGTMVKTVGYEISVEVNKGNHTSGTVNRDKMFNAKAKLKNRPEQSSSRQNLTANDVINQKNNNLNSGSLLSLITSIEEPSEWASDSDEIPLRHFYLDMNHSFPLLSLPELAQPKGVLIPTLPPSDRSLLRKITFRNNSRSDGWDSESSSSKYINLKATNGFLKPFLLSTSGQNIKQIGSPDQFSHRRFWPNFELNDGVEGSEEHFSNSMEKQKLINVMKALADSRPSLKTGLNLHTFSAEYVDNADNDKDNSIENNSKSALTSHNDSVASTINSTHAYFFHKIDQNFLTAANNHFREMERVEPGQNEEILPASMFPSSMDVKYVDSSVVDIVSNHTFSSPISTFPSVKRMLNEINKQTDGLKFNSNRTLPTPVREKTSSTEPTHVQTSVNTNFSSTPTLDLILIRENDLKQANPSNTSMTSSNNLGQNAFFKTSSSTQSLENTINSVVQPEFRSIKEVINDSYIETLPLSLPLISQGIQKKNNWRSGEALLNPHVSIFGPRDDTQHPVHELYNQDPADYDDYYTYDSKYNDDDSLKDVDKSHIDHHPFHEFKNEVAADSMKTAKDHVSVFRHSNDHGSQIEHPPVGKIWNAIPEDEHNQDSQESMSSVSSFSNDFWSRSDNEHYFTTLSSKFDVGNESIISSLISSTISPLQSDESVSSYSSFTAGLLNEDEFRTIPHETDHLSAPKVATSRSMLADKLFFSSTERNSMNLNYPPNIDLTTTQNKPTTSTRPFRASPSIDDPTAFTPTEFETSTPYHFEASTLRHPVVVQLSTPVPLPDGPYVKSKKGLYDDSFHSAQSSILSENDREYRTENDRFHEEESELLAQNMLLSYPLLPFNVTRRPNFSISSTTLPNFIINSIDQSKLSSHQPMFLNDDTAIDDVSESIYLTEINTHSSTALEKPTTLQQLLKNGHTIAPSASSLTYHEIPSPFVTNFGLENSNTRTQAPILQPHFAGVSNDLSLSPFSPINPRGHFEFSNQAGKVPVGTIIPQIIRQRVVPTSLDPAGHALLNNFQYTLNQGSPLYPVVYDHSLNLNNENEFKQAAHQDPVHHPSDLRLPNNPTFQHFTDPFNSHTLQLQQISLNDPSSPAAVHSPLTGYEGSLGHFSPLQRLISQSQLSPLQSPYPNSFGAFLGLNHEQLSQLQNSPSPPNEFLADPVRIPLQSSYPPSMQVYVSPQQHFGKTIPQVPSKFGLYRYPGEELLPEVYQYLFQNLRDDVHETKSSATSSQVQQKPSAVVEPLPMKVLKEILIDENGRLVQETFYEDNIKEGSQEYQYQSDDDSFTSEPNVDTNVASASLSPTNKLSSVNSATVKSPKQVDSKHSNEKNDDRLLPIEGSQGTFTTKNFIEQFISVTPIGNQDEDSPNTTPRVDLSAIANLLRPAEAPVESEEISVFTTVREALRGITTDPSYLAFPSEVEKAVQPNINKAIMAPIEIKTSRNPKQIGISKFHDFVLILSDAGIDISPSSGNLTILMPKDPIQSQKGFLKSSLEDLKLSDVLSKINETKDVTKLPITSGHLFRGQIELDTFTTQENKTSEKSLLPVNINSQNAIDVKDVLSFFESNLGSMRNDSLQLLLGRFTDDSKLLHLDTPVFIWRPGPRNAFGLRLLDDMHFILPSVDPSSESLFTTADSHTLTTTPPITTSIARINGKEDPSLNEEIVEKEEVADVFTDVNEIPDYSQDYEDSDSILEKNTALSTSVTDDSSSDILNNLATESPLGISTVNVIVPSVADDFIRELEKLFAFSVSAEQSSSPVLGLPGKPDAEIDNRKASQTVTRKKGQLANSISNRNLLAKLLASRNETPKMVNDPTLIENVHFDMPLQNNEKGSDEITSDFEAPSVGLQSNADEMLMSIPSTGSSFLENEAPHKTQAQHQEAENKPILLEQQPTHTPFPTTHNDLDVRTFEPFMDFTSKLSSRQPHHFQMNLPNVSRHPNILSVTPNNVLIPQEPILLLSDDMDAAWSSHEPIVRKGFIDRIDSSSRTDPLVRNDLLVDTDFYQLANPLIGKEASKQTEQFFHTDNLTQRNYSVEVDHFLQPEVSSAVSNSHMSPFTAFSHSTANGPSSIRVTRAYAPGEDFEDSVPILPFVIQNITQLNPNLVDTVDFDTQDLLIHEQEASALNQEEILNDVTGFTEVDLIEDAMQDLILESFDVTPSTPTLRTLDFSNEISLKFPSTLPLENLGTTITPENVLKKEYKVETLSASFGKPHNSNRNFTAPTLNNSEGNGVYSAKPSLANGYIMSTNEFSPHSNAPVNLTKEMLIWRPNFPKGVQGITTARDVYPLRSWKETRHDRKSPTMSESSRVDRIDRGTFVPVPGPFGTEQAPKRLSREQVEMLVMGGHLQQTKAGNPALKFPKTVPTLNKNQYLGNYSSSKTLLKRPWPSDALQPPGTPAVVTRDPRKLEDASDGWKWFGRSRKNP